MRTRAWGGGQLRALKDGEMNHSPLPDVAPPHPSPLSRPRLRSATPGTAAPRRSRSRGRCSCPSSASGYRLLLRAPAFRRDRPFRMCFLFDSGDRGRSGLGLRTRCKKNACVGWVSRNGVSSILVYRCGTIVESHAECVDGSLHCPMVGRHIICRWTEERGRG